jgi:replicative DNA helicase
LFCILDHTTLVNPVNRESELELVANLSKLSIKLKKQLPLTFLMLGQLNSNIESDDRRTNPTLHQPGRADLFGGKSVWNAMDCIFMPHRPELLKIDYYTPDEYPTQNRMFFHITKQRFGGVGTILMDCSKIGQNIVTEI